VVGLDEPRTFTVKPLERAGAEDQDNVAAIGFEPLQSLFGAGNGPDQQRFRDVGGGAGP
jgi:hypothetical protein